MHNLFQQTTQQKFSKHNIHSKKEPIREVLSTEPLPLTIKYSKMEGKRNLPQHTSDAYVTSTEGAFLCFL